MSSEECIEKAMEYLNYTETRHLNMEHTQTVLARAQTWALVAIAEAIREGTQLT